MKKSEVRELKPGAYVLSWKTGGASLATVGITKDGGRWLAPVNWVSPSIDQKFWRKVKNAELVGEIGRAHV